MRPLDYDDYRWGTLCIQEEESSCWDDSQYEYTTRCEDKTEENGWEE